MHEKQTKIILLFAYHEKGSIVLVVEMVDWLRDIFFYDTFIGDLITLKWWFMMDHQVSLE